MEEIGPSLQLSFRFSILPLFGLLAGGWLGKFLAGVPGFTAPVQQALGPVLGPFLTASDNLILFLGLFGLLLSAGFIKFQDRKPRKD